MAENYCQTNLWIYAFMQYFRLLLTFNSKISMQVIAVIACRTTTWKMFKFTHVVCCVSIIRCKLCLYKKKKSTSLCGGFCSVEAEIPDWHSDHLSAGWVESSCWSADHQCLLSLWWLHLSQYKLQKSSQYVFIAISVCLGVPLAFHGQKSGFEPWPLCRFSHFTPPPPIPAYRLAEATLHCLLMLCVQKHVWYLTRL